MTSFAGKKIQEQMREARNLIAPISEQALGDALNEITRQNLIISALVMAFLYLAYSFSHWLLLPRSIIIPIFTSAALSVPASLIIRWWLSRSDFPLRQANVAASMLVGIILINSFLHLALTDDPHHTTNLMLMLCAAGFISLSTPWLIFYLVLTYFGFGLLAIRSSSGEWVHFGFALGVAGVLAVVVHFHRIRVFTRLESLRFTEHERLEQLQYALVINEQSRQEAIASREAMEKMVETVRTAEERFRSFTNLEGIAIYDNGEILDANSTLAEMFGYEPLEILRLNVQDLFTSDSYPGSSLPLQSGSEQFFSATGRKKNGQTFPVELFSRPTKYRGLETSVLSVRDVTKQQETVKALHDSEERYRHLFDSSPLPMWVFDIETLDFLAVNEAAVKHYGYSRREFLSMRATDIRPAEESRRFTEVARIYAKGPKESGVWKHRKKDGSVIDVTITSHELDFNNRSARLVIATDITSRMRVETALREYADRLKILRHMDQAILAAQLPEDISRAVLPSLQKLVPCERLSMSTIDQQKLEVQIQAVISNISTELKPGMRLPLLPGKLKHLQAGEAYYIRDTETADDLSPQMQLLRREGYRSFLSVPIVYQGMLLASINLSSTRPAAFTPSHMEIARDVADTLALAIQNARLYEAERKARAEAEKADRLKDEFLATVSHELRTPLNAIIGWNHLLRRGKPGTDLLERAHLTIERNARAQAHLINDLLDVSRIISGKLRLSVRLLELQPIIEDVIESLRPAANAKNIRILKHFNAESATISGDSDRLQQILWNLLSNAIKFTPNGGKVGIQLAKQDSLLRVEVTDTGKGIPREFLPHVFDRFRQADSSSTRAYGGLGLGLAIVRHLVELHGGTVQADSPGENLGATFTVCLPLAELRVSEHGLRIESALPASATTEPGSALLAGVRILIVEDENDTREMLATLLAGYGAETRVTGTSTEALEIVQSWNPVLLLSDIGLPGFDGYWLLDEIRRREKGSGRQLPAIALTAYARNDDRQRALSHGFQMHISKPFEPSELALAIAQLLGRQTENAPIRSS